MLVNDSYQLYFYFRSSIVANPTLHIETDSSWQPEKEYILRCLFEEYLGVPIELSYADNNTFIISLGNSTLEIGDHFFSEKNAENYIRQKKLPSKSTFADYGSLAENLPVLFGTTDFAIETNRIFIDSDIPAACFFMLTRWEEILEKDKDHHERSRAKNSIAYKWDFLHRPIVDEFADLLWNCLIYLGYKGTRKERKFEFVHTHDVDEINKWDGTRTLTRTLTADIVKRKSSRLARANLKQSQAVRKGIEKDPYDTFDEMMSLSEAKGVKSHFFFLHEGTHELDKSYSWDDPAVEQAIRKILDRGHEIGLHPTYNTFNDTDLFKKEKQEFTQRFGIQPKTGRQHFLRFSTPETWQIWEDASMDWDSTMYYSEQVGFRCGTCRDFPVFNVQTRKQLNLRELPLTFMDATYFAQIDAGQSDKLLESIVQVLETVKRHEGKFVLLWHTNYLNLPIFEPHKRFYLRLLEKI